MENNTTVFLKYEDGDFERMGEGRKDLMKKFIEENQEVGVEEDTLVEFALNMVARGTFGYDAFEMFMKELGITKLTLNDGIVLDFDNSSEAKEISYVA